MKKILVAVLVVAIALMGASAFAGIKGTKHDLSSTGGQAVSSSNEAQICIFCHTPHTSNTGVPAPLWNRNASAEAFTGYNSSTTNYSGASTPGPVSLACLSCHDGLVDEALVNPGAIGQPTYANNALSTGDLTDGGASLTNDHPVGNNVVMATINAVDAGIYDSPNGTTAIRLFGGAVECGSCHNVHNNSNAPFLAMSNDGSNMCLACHAK